MYPFGGWEKEEPKEQSRGCQGCAELPEPALILPPRGGDGHKRHPCKNPPFTFCRSGFLNLGAVDILGRTILHGEGLPVHWRLFSGIPGLSPLDASGTPRWDNPKYL